MDRRSFIRLVGGGAVVAATAACAPTGPDPRAAWNDPGAGETDIRRKALSYALLAPNPHNMQPWIADLRTPGEITLYVDPARLLPVTDPFNRQIVIGFGAFLALFSMAALEFCDAPAGVRHAEAGLPRAPPRTRPERRPHPGAGPHRLSEGGGSARASPRPRRPDHEGPRVTPDASRLARDRIDVQVMTEIGIISQLSNARLEKVSGLPAAQFALLSHFMRRGGEESPAQLASAFQVGKSAMTHTLQRAEAAGWIAIRPDPSDGRRKWVSLTAAGAAAYGEAVKGMRPHLEAMRSAFTDEEFQAALPFLRALRTWLDDNR